MHQRVIGLNSYRILQACRKAARPFQAIETVMEKLPGITMRFSYRVHGVHWRKRRQSYGSHLTIKQNGVRVVRTESCENGTDAAGFHCAVQLLETWLRMDARTARRENRILAEFEKVIERWKA